MPLSKTDCRDIHRKMNTVQETVVEYLYRGNNDDFMLRVEMLDLKLRIEEILERGKKHDS